MAHHGEHGGRWIFDKVDRVIQVRQKHEHVIDEHQWGETVVKTAVPLGCPVSPVQFKIYLSKEVQEVEADAEKGTTTSFADGCSWLITIDSMEQVCKRLARA